MSMKLSLNTWMYSSFPVWVPAYTLDETIKRIAGIGYDGIEIGAAAPHAYPAHLNKERRKEIKKLLDDSGIAVSSMLPAPGGGPGFNVASPLVEERQEAVDQYKKVIELCSDLGGPTVMYIAGWQIYGTPRIQAWNWSREALSKIAKTAADFGVMLVVEPTPTDSNLVESCDDAIEMMEQVGAKNVGLMFDTQHAYYRNEVPTDYVYRMDKDLRHVHLSEFGRLPPGAGRGDFVGLVAALRKIEYKGYLTMEIGFNRRDVEPDLVARQAYDYLKPLVSKK
ncbi:MAG: sugar phosphate isomerase/epimerase [Verrucomicrobia bacterium]|nr:sugar phosphate isomerase/epimerase [Verrucomicrobiota bacterium]MBV9643940.1 sugar phosphate isomerase/epimerase [Verrucomicrobiota bacterium]